MFASSKNRIFIFRYFKSSKRFSTNGAWKTYLKTTVTGVVVPDYSKRMGKKAGQPATQSNAPPAASPGGTGSSGSSDSSGSDSSGSSKTADSVERANWWVVETESNSDMIICAVQQLLLIFFTCGVCVTLCACSKGCDSTSCE